MVKSISIRLFGPLRLYGADGQELRVKSAKQRAIIALLAVSPNMTRSRRWLESKLWSDRAPDQAHASMRGALSKLRKALGPSGDVLVTEDTDVKLVGERVDTDLDSYQTAIAAGHDFLEGIQIADEEWNDWLRMTRQRFQPTTELVVGIATERQRLTLTCVHRGSGGELASLAAEYVTRNIATSVGEHVPTTITDEHHVCSAGTACVNACNRKSDFHIECTIADDDDNQRVFVKVLSAANQVVFYRALRHQGRAGKLFDADNVAAVTYQAAEHALEFLTSNSDDGIAQANPSLSMAREAVASAFGFSVQYLDHADRLLRKAYELEPNPSYLAWRAFLKNVKSIESPNGVDHNLLQEEARLLADRASHDGHQNALVLSLCSLVQVMMLDDIDRGMDYARAAMDLNPGSAFALQAIAMAHVVNGDTGLGYTLSQKSHRMAANSRFGHWWDLVHSFACISDGRLEEAYTLARTAARKAPNFRPPQRALLALNCRSGDIAAAVSAKNHLQSIEHDFSLQRYFDDPAYPIRTIRTAGLLDIPRNTLLELENG